MGDTIFDIRSAGIQVWVLTGDKVETAINIGHSCKLLDSEMNKFILQAATSDDIKQELDELREQ